MDLWFWDDVAEFLWICGFGMKDVAEFSNRLLCEVLPEIQLLKAVKTPEFDETI